VLHGHTVTAEPDAGSTPLHAPLAGCTIAASSSSGGTIAAGSQLAPRARDRERCEDISSRIHYSK
jgi:hypothetical protein